MNPLMEENDQTVNKNQPHCHFHTQVGNLIILETLCVVHNVHIFI